MEYKLLIDGEWIGSGPVLEVKNKYDGSTVGVLPTASREDLNKAIDAAERAEDIMADMPAYKRSEILLRAASLLRERADDLAKTIAAEAGKASSLLVPKWTVLPALSRLRQRKRKDYMVRQFPWMPSQRAKVILVFGLAAQWV